MTGRSDHKYLPVSGEGEDYAAQLIVPIVSEGDAVGAVVFLAREKRTALGETELKLAQIAAGFLGKQMEG